MPLTYAQRDGNIADEAAKAGLGAGGYTARLLPLSHVVKAFNTVLVVRPAGRAPDRFPLRPVTAAQSRLSRSLFGMRASNPFTPEIWHVRPCLIPGAPSMPGRSLRQL